MPRRMRTASLTGAQLFDRMSRTQQIASLEVVARYLFFPTAECLPLTAWSEATLASILQVIRDFIQTEIEDGHDDDCRQVVLSVLGPVEELGDIHDAEAWQWVLDAYEDRFLWDSDYEDEQLSDLPPEHARRVRAMMTIDDEYYTAIPPDLAHQRDVLQGRKRLMMVIDGKKTIRMTASITCEVPASMTIEEDCEGMPVLEHHFPALIIMRRRRDGTAQQLPENRAMFYLDGAEVDHTIEELPENGVSREADTERT